MKAYLDINTHMLEARMKILLLEVMESPLLAKLKFANAWLIQYYVHNAYLKYSNNTKSYFFSYDGVFNQKH